MSDEHSGGSAFRPRLADSLLSAIALILVLAALSWGRAIFAPVAFAIFIVMLIWPLQRQLQSHMPRPLAIVVALLVMVLCVGALAFLFTWGVSAVGQWTIRNAARFQELYRIATAWLDEHGFAAADSVFGTLNLSSLFSVVQATLSRVNGVLGFAALVFAFAVLGLFDADGLLARIKSVGGNVGGVDVIAVGGETAGHFRKYMIVRTFVSAVTAAAVWIIASLVGLELAGAWAAITFTLNYIPFIGSVIATLLPTLFALAQFESLPVALLVLACLTALQFVIGSYLEPVITGSTLSLSPFGVMLIVLVWSMLWGLAGAFIGVPVLIAVMAVSRRVPSLQWLAVLFSGGEKFIRPA